MNNFGYVFATKMLIENKRKVRFMYRERGDNPNDSGWRFFCGEEEQSYIDNPNNIAIYDIQTILDIDESISPYLQADYGVAFEREDENESFIMSSDYSFEAEDE